jgi:hypothetical protein
VTEIATMKYFYEMRTVISIAYYTKEQYELLLKLADDRKKLSDTWEEWLGEFIKARTSLEASGLEVRKFDVDLLRMSEYFKQHKAKNTSKNRAAYVSEMASKLDL